MAFSGYLNGFAKRNRHLFSGSVCGKRSSRDRGTSGAPDLEHTANASSIWCTHCDSPHSVSVEFCGDAAYRAYCQEVGFFGVDPDDLRVLELDLAALADLIHRGFGIPSRLSTEEVVPRFLYRLGSLRFGPYRTRLYFARCLDRVRCFAEVYSALEQHRDRIPVILVSTTSWQRIQRELPARHALVSLLDVAELSGQLLKFNEDAFLTKLRGEDVRSEQGASAMSSVRASVRPSLETKIPIHQKTSRSRRSTVSSLRIGSA